MSDRRVVISRWAALLGFFGLLLVVLVWQGVYARDIVSPTLTLFLTVTPLMLPLRGILHGRVLAHAWTIYLSLPYFIHGVGEAFSTPVNRTLSSLEIIFSLMLFVGCIFYTRYRGRQIKARQAAETESAP